MRTFREGAFLVAKKTGTGIIPIVHIGSENTFDQGSWVLKGRAHIQIRVLDEITSEEVDFLEVKDLMSLVRKRMEEGLDQLDNKSD